MPDPDAIVASVPELAGASVVRPLSTGPVNWSWLLARGDSQLVLRVDGPLAGRLGLDRRGEREIMDAVFAAGLGPEVAGADPHAGWLLTRYVPGRHWRTHEISDPGNLEQLARRLRQLHRLPPVGPMFDPGRIARGYAEQIGTASAAELAEGIDNQARVLYAGAGLRAICHNDLVAANIIASDPLTFIDWEYAAVGDPLFDLAVIVREQDLGPADTHYLLRSWSGDAAKRSRLEAFTGLYDDLAKLWRLLVNTRH